MFFEYVVLLMLVLLLMMECGGIVWWYCVIGDEIKVGDVIVDVEMDKVMMVMEVMDDGYLVVILVFEGVMDVEVGMLVCVMCEEVSVVVVFKDYKATEMVMMELVKSVVEMVVMMLVVRVLMCVMVWMSVCVSGEWVFASSLARRLVEERGVRLEIVSGSGLNGCVIVEDVFMVCVLSVSEVVMYMVVVEYLLFKFFLDFEDVSVSVIKRVIAERLMESK